jgi:hypothetical protein
MKFEYLTIAFNLPKDSYDFEDSDKILNSYGKDGWELVLITNDNAIFKREVKTPRMVLND